MPSRVAVGLIAMLLGAGQSACAAPAASTVGGSITVFAASSLTHAFTRIGANFENAHPGAVVHVTFAGSSTLAAQIEQGAIGDIFASADQPTMQRLVNAGLVSGSPSIFARNRLQIVVAAGNPKHIGGRGRPRPRAVGALLSAPAGPPGGGAAPSSCAPGATRSPARRPGAGN